MTKDEIYQLFAELNEELRLVGQKGEIGIVGGAVMCLVYNTRAATRAVDAIFEPSAIIREFAAKIATRHNLPSDWLNDGAKGYLVKGFEKESVQNLSCLEIWAPDARYMLAMKCISARWDSADADDVAFLLAYLKLSSAQQVFDLIQNYYPAERIAAKTQFFIEELCEKTNPKVKA